MHHPPPSARPAARPAARVPDTRCPAGAVAAGAQAGVQFRCLRPFLGADLGGELGDKVGERSKMVASAAIVSPRFLGIPVGPLPTRGRRGRRRRQEEGGAPRISPPGLFLLAQGWEDLAPGPVQPPEPCFRSLIWSSLCMAASAWPIVSRTSGEAFPRALQGVPF